MNQARRVKLVCFVMMLLFLAVAAGRLAAGAAPLVDPALSTARLHCEGVRCTLETDPIQLLSAVNKKARLLSPARRSEFEARLQQPDMKKKLFAAEFLRALPTAFLFLSLGLASHALRREEAGSAIRWLRKAAAAALAAVIVQPVSDSIRATIVSPFLTGTDQLFLTVDGRTLLWGVLVAGAVWMAAWTVDQARLTEAELAAIV